ncbi:MAG TPA: hypothetical protein VFC39_06995 [Acidobacteriaceae bacterium]|nr:hypothetical protein [Acidobacteriaceae bacterium]
MITAALDDTGKRVLRVIQQSGVVPGWQLMSEASVSQVELFNAASRLLDMGLISTSGNVGNSPDIAQTFFNLKPSSRQYAVMLMNQS